MHTGTGFANGQMHTGTGSALVPIKAASLLGAADRLAAVR